MTRSSYLSPPDFHRLNWACRPVVDAFPDAYGVYLVGSVNERPDFRDIDLRMILPDKKFKRLIPTAEANLFLNVVISDFIAKTSGLPWQIDFQIESMTEANRAENAGKHRNPMGTRRALFVDATLKAKT